MLLEAIVWGGLTGLFVAYLVVSHSNRVHRRKMENLRKFFRDFERGQEGD